MQSAAYKVLVVLCRLLAHCHLGATISKLLADVVVEDSTSLVGPLSSREDDETSGLQSGAVGCCCCHILFKICWRVEAVNCSSVVPSVAKIVFCLVARVFVGINWIFWNLNNLSVISLFSLDVMARPWFAFQLFTPPTLSCVWGRGIFAFSSQAKVGRLQRVETNPNPLWVCCHPIPHQVGVSLGSPLALEYL